MLGVTATGSASPEHPGNWESLGAVLSDQQGWAGKGRHPRPPGGVSHAEALTVCQVQPASNSRLYSGWFGLRWSPRYTTSLQSWSQDLLLRGRTGWGLERTNQDRGEGSEVGRGRTHSEKCCSTTETEKGNYMSFQSHPSLLGGIAVIMPISQIQRLRLSQAPGPQ